MTLGIDSLLVSAKELVMQIYGLVIVTVAIDLLIFLPGVVLRAD